MAEVLMLKRMIPPLILVLGVGAAVFYFNQDTRHDVMMRHEAEFATIRQQLARLASVVRPPPPPPRTIPSTGCNGVPPGARPFKFDRGDAAGTNTGLVTQAQLRDPAGPAGEWSVIEPDLARYVAATAPGYRPTEADEERASEEFGRWVQAMANVRYVVVVWTDRSEGFAQNGPWDDTLGVEAHIADLRTGKSLCFVHAAGGLGDRGRILYAYPGNGGPGAREESASEAVDSILRSAGKTELEKKLNGLGRGHFDLDTE
ncbi:hypothetical protein [Actinomadura sp. 21ATH]|uniref:hypothetical protein n=1 Tax=Actinomadura sp. 21ATH TaxID=1735444 RepID=UPI0035BEDD71